MTDLLLQVGVSNVCISVALACVAFAVHRTGRLPLVAHLLWVLVLVKLVTPPLFTLPVVPIPFETASTTIADVSTQPFAAHAEPVDALIADAGPAVKPTPHASDASALVDIARPTLLGIWLAGSLVVLVWSLTRIWRFNRMLSSASSDAPSDLQATAYRLATRLGLRRTPRICTTTAHISPMVWWIGGRVHIVIPDRLIDEVTHAQLRWIIAHELAHVKRRDHCVRWLEWLACVGFWWNPIAWWARRNLRINEEICCDALVLTALQPQPHTYANALMSVVEFLACPAIRPPAVASEINSGGTLERRFTMIVSTHRIVRTPRWLVGCVLAAAVGFMPLGVAYAQDFNAVERRLGDAVAHGEITLEQAQLMLDALRTSTANEAIGSDGFIKKKNPTADARDVKIISSERMQEAREKIEALRERGRSAEQIAKGRAAADAARAKAEEARAKMTRQRQQQSDIADEAAGAIQRQSEAENLIRRLHESARQGKTDDVATKALIERLRALEAHKAVRQQSVEAILERARQNVDEKAASGDLPAGIVEKLRQEIEQERHAIRERRDARDSRDGPDAVDEAVVHQRQRERDQADVAKELKQMVEAGRISASQARARLDALKQALAERERAAAAEAAAQAAAAKRIRIRTDHEALRAQLDVMKQRYADAAADLEKRLAEGKISAEHARERINELRQRIAELAARADEDEAEGQREKE